MEQLRFKQRWRNIMALIQRQTTSRILLHGEPGKPIKHGRGLCQGDPLSPMLFIVAMDPLQLLLEKPTQERLLTLIGGDPVKMRTSLYADDAILFFHPTARGVEHLQHLLQAFRKTMSLCTNITKLEILPIRCDQIDLSEILGNFQALVGALPRKYLGPTQNWCGAGSTNGSEHSYRLHQQTATEISKWGWCDMIRAWQSHQDTYRPHRVIYTA
jgi:hypothetical protein